MKWIDGQIEPVDTKVDDNTEDIERRAVCVKRNAVTGRCMKWIDGQTETVDTQVDDNTAE
eukprot:Awhi_evm1s15525